MYCNIQFNIYSTQKDHFICLSKLEVTPLDLLTHIYTCKYEYEYFGNPVSFNFMFNNIITVLYYIVCIVLNFKIKL